MILDEIKNSLNIKEVISIGILLSLLMVTPFNGVQFILLALVPILYFVTDKSAGIALGKYDLTWCMFLGIATLSIFWSRDVSLIWYQLFGWSLMIFWMLMSRSWLNIERNQRILSLLIQGVFWVLLVHQLIAINFEISLSNVNWNQFLFKNSNYTSSYVVGLYSFVLFSNASSKLYRFIRLVAGALVLNILCLSKDPIGALVAMAFLVVSYLLSQKTTKVKLLGLLAVPILVFVVALFNNSSLSAFLFSDEAGSRIHLMSASVDVFLSQPIMGIGLGQWFNEVYNVPLPNVSPFNNPTELIRLPSHNIYTEKLAELGVLGSLTLTAGLIYPVWVVVKGSSKSMLSLGAAGALMVYAVTSIFFHDVNFHDHHFSSLQLLAFISIGLITRDLVDNKGKAILNYVLIFISGLALIWFIYIRQVHGATHDIVKNIDNQEMAISIDAIESLKSMTFHGHFNSNTSLDQIIGNLYADSGNYAKANEAYQRALNLSPYNSSLHISYLESLIKSGAEENEIRALLDKAIDIDPYSNRLKELQLQYVDQLKDGE